MYDFLKMFIPRKLTRKNESKTGIYLQPNTLVCIFARIEIIHSNDIKSIDRGL